MGLAMTLEAISFGAQVELDFFFFNGVRNFSTSAVDRVVCDQGHGQRGVPRLEQCRYRSRILQGQAFKGISMNRNTRKQHASLVSLLGSASAGFDSRPERILS
jgi:hypothetical protein